MLLRENGRYEFRRQSQPWTGTRQNMSRRSEESIFTPVVKYPGSRSSNLTGTDEKVFLQGFS